MRTMPGTGKTGAAALLALLALLTALGSGCSMLRLRENVARLDQTSLISGTVTAVPSAEKPICVALYTDVPGQEKKALNAYQVIYQNGLFSFRRPPGDYYLFAFEDANEDGTFQDDERVGWYGSPSLLKARRGAAFDGLELVLRAPSAAMRELPRLYAPTAPRTALRLEWRHLGEVVELGAPRFEPDVGLLGMWAPVEFLEKHGAGLFFLEPYDARKIPVLFVHGAGGTPRNFQYLIEHMDRERFQPWVFQYPSGLRLSLLANGMAAFLVEMQARHHFQSAIVVAHSMGGLVSRGAINLLTSQGRTFVPLFVSISTPWQGHPAAGSGVDRSPVIMPSWYDVAPGSAYLKSLQETGLPASTSYFLMFGHRGGRSMFSGANNDGTLPLSSMLDIGMQDAAVKVLGFNESHAGILSSPEASERLNRILKDEAGRAGQP